MAPALCSRTRPSLLSASARPATACAQGAAHHRAITVASGFRVPDALAQRAPHPWCNLGVALRQHQRSALNQPWLLSTGGSPGRHSHRRLRARPIASSCWAAASRSMLALRQDQVERLQALIVETRSTNTHQGEIRVWIAWRRAPRVGTRCASHARQHWQDGSIGHWSADRASFPHTLPPINRPEPGSTGASKRG